MIARFADDAALAVGLRAREEAAFGELLDRYDALLRRIARRSVASEAVAEEVVADTWEAVLRGIDRFEGRSSIKTWLVRILTNLAITRGTRDARQVPFSSLRTAGHDEHLGGFGRFRFEPDDEPTWPRHWAVEIGDWGHRPLDHLLGDEVLSVVRTSAGGLPPLQRAVFMLRDIEGWDSAEVVQALEISEANQRLLLHRARCRVRAALDMYFASAGVQRRTSTWSASRWSNR